VRAAIPAGAERSQNVVGVLRDAGTALIAQLRTAPPDRSTALTLLAADALITLACEATAELEPETLGEFG
jgi:hypothetical protein